MFRWETATNLPKARVKLIFAYPNPQEPNWPHIGYDFQRRIAEIQEQLQQGW